MKYRQLLGNTIVQTRIIILRLPNKCNKYWSETSTDIQLSCLQTSWLVLVPFVLDLPLTDSPEIQQRVNFFVKLEKSVYVTTNLFEWVESFIILRRKSRATKIKSAF